jgi:hypothetical protein
MPEGCFTDGVLIDVPKRRRREQAMSQRPMTIKWPRDLKMRFATQVNRFIELCSKEVGLDLMIRILERWTDEDITKAVEGQSDGTEGT